MTGRRISHTGQALRKPNGLFCKPERTDPIGTPTPNKITVAEAAARLNTSEDALRKRIRRGSLPAVREQGRWWVLWPPPDEQATGQATRPIGQAEQAASPPQIALLEARIAYLEETIRRLDSERDRLAAALEHARQQQAAHIEEVLRKDIIIQQLAQRIPALPSPEEMKDEQRRPWWQVWKR